MLLEPNVSRPRAIAPDATVQPLLSVKAITTAYRGLVALTEASLDVAEGEIVAVVGSNGAGKSTLLKSIAGLERPRAGAISFGGHNIERLNAHVITASGLAYVPENRRLFPRLSVADNLRLGSYLHAGKPDREAPLERVFALFPRLKERLGQRAETLSGGEQQMLAIARALMSRPKLLLLDEPSLGLAPLIVAGIFNAIRELNRLEGLTVFLVEQNAYHALKLAHRGYVMVNGAVTLSGTGAELLAREEVRAAYLEGGRH